MTSCNDKPQALFNGRPVHEWRDCPVHGKVPASYVGVYGDVWPISECPKCKEQRLMEERLNGSMIPRRFRNKTLDNFETKEKFQQFVKTIADDYVADLENNIANGVSLVFLGPCGTGKTHLACGIAHEAIKRGYTALFVSVSTLIRKVRASWGTKTEEEVLKVFTNCDFMILDEVGIQAGTENERNILFDVLNTRYADMRPTIVISNLKLVEITNYLGTRIIDRLSENGGQVVPFKGAKSFRQGAKA